MSAPVRALLVALFLGLMTVPSHANAPALPVQQASSSTPDSGGGIFGWRCKHNGNGNTLYAINWLGNRTNRVGCETDARLTADGRWVIWHDKDLCVARQDTLPENAVPCSLSMRDLTYQEAIKVRYAAGRQLPVASAARFFAKAGAANVPLMVEVKREHGVTQTQINALVQLADSRGADVRWEVWGGRSASDPNTFGGYVIRMLRDAGARRVGAKSTPANPEQLANLGATFLSTRPVTPEKVATYAAYGITLRSKMAQPRKWAGVKSTLGGDRFITNKPVRAWRTRKQR